MKRIHTDVPEVKSVKSRVTPASTEMPSSTMVVQLAFPAFAAEADVKVQSAVALPASAELLLELELPVETEAAAEVVDLPSDPDEVFVAELSVGTAVAEVVVVFPLAFGMGVPETRDTTPRASPIVESN